MVDLFHSPERVYACLVMHGAPVFVRFDDERDFSRFYHSCSTSPTTALVQVTGYDNGAISVRPSAVDVIVKGAKPNGE
jgi:hypothetical protein